MDNILEVAKTIIGQKPPATPFKQHDQKSNKSQIYEFLLQGICLNSNWLRFRNATNAATQNQPNIGLKWMNRLYRLIVVAAYLVLQKQ